MKLQISSFSMCSLSLLAGFGFLAGTVNGLFGTGAGLCFLLCFRILSGSIERDAFGVSMAAVLPLSVCSLLTYPLQSDTSQILPLLVTGLAGGFTGAALQNRIPVSLLKKIFGALVLWGGVSMLLR